MFKFTGFFCYVCGEFTPNAHKEKMSTRILDAYYSYFGSNACRNISEHWTPNLYNYFTGKLDLQERNTWLSFVKLTKGFLGNTRSSNYSELVSKLLKDYNDLGCNMSLKIHFLHLHLDFFPPNIGVVSDEHGERFHQNVMEIDRRYQGKWAKNILANFCWTMVRDNDDHLYKRQAKRMNRN